MTVKPTIENWPFSSFSLTTTSIQKSHSITIDHENSNCFLGDANLTTELFDWVHDTQETLFLQVAIFKNTPEDSLKQGFQLEIFQNQAKDKILWKKDVNTLLKMADPNINWDSSFCKETWKYAQILEIKGIGHESSKPYAVNKLLKLLEQIDFPIAIQHNFVLHWYQPKTKPLPTMPDEVFSNPRHRRHWLASQKHRQRIEQAPKRNISHRMIVYSDQPLSSLVKQRCFRAMKGNIQAKAIWHQNYSLQNKTLSAPEIFREKLSFSDKISPSQMHSILTANQGVKLEEPEEEFLGDGGIPF